MENFVVIKSTQSEEIAWGVTLVVVGIIITAINTLTLLTFMKSTSLRSRKHVMVINLAVADLLFGAAGIPSTVALLLKSTTVSFYVFQTTTTFSKLASLITLAVIAVERMHAILWPIRHKILHSHLFKKGLWLIWSLSAIFTAISLLNLAGFGAMKASIFAALLPIVIVAVVITIVACYISIWVSFRRRKRRNLGTVAMALRKEKALSITLLLVAGTFIVTWAIPMLFVLISQMCKTCYEPSMTLRGCMLLAFAAQSLVNPLIYCFRLPGFRDRMKAKVQMINCSEEGRRLRKRKTTVGSEMSTFSGNEGNYSVNASVMSAT